MAYSCNAPVPSELARLARGIAADLIDATPRDRHTLVVKRLGEGDSAMFAGAIREAISGIPPCAARVTGVELFDDPPSGPAPVAALAVESPGLRRMHDTLCDRFDPVEAIEGDSYVPHVTVARGGDAHRLDGRDVTFQWTVGSVTVWSADYGEPLERISLPT